MNVLVPATLSRQINREFGPEGVQWLESLPERIAQLERAWHFRAGAALDHGGACSWVAPVTLTDGSLAILKVGIPREEARLEAEALRFLNGQGAVHLLQSSHDGFSLLLEPCVPGTDLWSLREDEGDAVAANLLPRLWRELGTEAPFVSLTEIVGDWCDMIPRIAAGGGYDAGLAAQAVALGRDLAASQPKRVLLHGDFHPGNVLAAQREPWLVIDPKPLVGDAAYDLAQWLGNRRHEALKSIDPAAHLARQTERFAVRLELDSARIAGWAFVKAFGWEWGPEVASLFAEVLELVTPT
jgi:streptomycin 6-kinase